MWTSARRHTNRHATYSRCVLVSTALCGLLAGAPTAASEALTLAGSLPFHVDTGSTWWDAPPTFESVLAETLVGPQLPGLPSIVSVPAVGKFGVGVDFGLGINLGLNTRVSDFHTGSIRVNYPIDYELIVPQKVRPGESFTIKTSYELGGGAGFNAQSHDGRIDLGARTGLEARLGVDVCFISCFLDSSGNGNLVDVSAPFGTLDLITKTPGSTEINVIVPGHGKPTIEGSTISLPGAIDLTRPLESAIAAVTNVSGDLRTPNHEVVGELHGTTLKGASTDVFTDINVDIDGFTPLGKVLGNTVTSGAFTAGYNILDASLETQLVSRQELAFDAVPMVRLDLGPLGVHEVVLGEDLVLTMPDGAGSLAVAPEFFLDDTLSNRISLAALQQYLITAGQLELDLPSYTTPTIPAVIVDPPEVCIPFTSICTDPPPFTLTPEIPGVTVFSGVNFSGTAYETAFADEIFLSLPGGLGSLNLETCELTPEACDLLPLLAGSVASQLFESAGSLDFAQVRGQPFAITAVPIPAAGPLMAAALGWLGWSARRRSSRC